ncbi:hypothetical protein BpHYR1_019628 [Brachionus plicatilis]|uniref:Uncharacterized protein n=1 Tax=Brachionus plicatilis TaxID=10195 RepID=A0A3M7QFH1_BRAPC|nr:hypothetical protein BpHYR1_019628 [Brachionus plicatilis]
MGKMLFIKSNNKFPFSLKNITSILKFWPIIYSLYDIWFRLNQYNDPKHKSDFQKIKDKSPPISPDLKLIELFLSSKKKSLDLT